MADKRLDEAAASLMELLRPPVTEQRSRSISLEADEKNSFDSLKNRLYHRAVAVLGLSHAATQLGAYPAPSLLKATVDRVEALVESGDPESEIYKELACRTQRLIDVINAMVREKECVRPYG